MVSALSHLPLRTKNGSPRLSASPYLTSHGPAEPSWSTIEARSQRCSTMANALTLCSRAEAGLTGGWKEASGM